MSDWKLEQSQFYNGAERKKHGQSVELIFDAYGLEVHAESGNAYDCSSERVNIPVTILVAMMRHAGWTLKGPSDAEE